MTDVLKLRKLTEKLQHFSTQLEKIKDFTVHRHINQFYYMQKVTELTVLVEQLEDSRKRLSSLTTFIENEYASIFAHWNRDVRWLHRYQWTHTGSSKP